MLSVLSLSCFDLVKKLYTPGAEFATRCLDRTPLNGGVENFDEVEGTYGPVHAAKLLADLQQASRIARDERVCLGADDVSCFTLAQLVRRGRLDQIVDARGSTADAAFGELDQIEFWDTS